ncbi:glycosyl transferase family 2 [Methanothermus fervidus DSM 2088]|uniref:Glycosyl transferase family 2 n=1 Tax=Methanothermus fervidus (strain ATCC 43054 / DSM 2088 / JCM 10308 / V24 S) TaxID=523846 RepID=E3GXG9_METFV|nr:glycosyltransferase family 2 protein [Methanothermus fervidus]ADP77001.1 glycosyl transferase family 2 [Methanothermus fervidus DSM 2088]
MVDKVMVVVPAYNEEKHIEEVVTELCERNYEVVVVNDGSEDRTREILKKLKSKYRDKLHVYHHIVNAGLGVALKTGIKAALRKNADYIVTFDADGQHDPDDIQKLLNVLKRDKADVVIGKRNFSEMPFSRRIGNIILNFITFLFYGLHVNDSQCGLRAFTRNAAEKIEIYSRGYSVSSDIIGEIKRKNLKIEEVNIKTLYTEYSLNKGTNPIEGIKIALRIMINRFRR